MSKLLFIQYRPYGAVMNGGDQCTKRNYDMLCNVLGAENVDVFYMHGDVKRNSLLSYVRGVLYMSFGYFFGLTPSRVKQIVEKANGYEYVFIDRSVFGRLAWALKQNGYTGKIITHFHNVEKCYFDAKLPKNLPLRNILIHCVDRNDAQACECSDNIIALNQRDVTQLEQVYGAKRTQIIPISLADKGCAIVPSDEMTSERLKCLFLGSYFPANNEGIVWFMQNVYPKVDVEVKIVGRGMAKLKEEQPELLRDIEVISDALSLEPYFAEADMMVLPIFSGSGMKVKTCESLMYGKNIIATDEALEGYKIEEGVSAWRCNTPEEFIACINDFAQHPRQRFNQHARQCFLDNYSNEAVERKFKELLS